MNSFEKSFERVIGNEGGFTADPTDRGNWTSGRVGHGVLKGTKFGISAMTYPNLDIANLTVTQAKEIYKRDWWDKFSMGRFGKSLSFQVFDSALNHGFFPTVKLLQRAVDVVDDGVIGPKTLEAVMKRDVSDLLMLFLAERIRLFTTVSTFQLHGKGWMRRVAENLRHASEDN